VVNLYLVTEPLRSWRHVLVSEQRTRLDFACCVKDLVDVHDPDAERIVLVLDQLNTHSPASLYAVFPPAEAERLADKLEIHHTPKHGSWLTMAEVELSVLRRRSLPRTPVAKPPATPSTGSSPSSMPAPNCVTSTRQLTTDL